MGKKPILAIVMATLMVPTLAPVEAQARKHSYRTYRGSDGRYHRCKRSKGTTGTIAGGAGGAVVAGALGASPVGVIAAGVGGGLLGRTLDKRHDRAQNRKNGC